MCLFVIQQGDEIKKKIDAKGSLHALEMVVSARNEWIQMNLEGKRSYLEMAEKITTQYYKSYA